MLTPLEVLVGEILPQDAPEQPAPVSVQVTPMFAESLETVAMNCAAVATCTVPELEETEIAIAGLLGTGDPDVAPTVHPDTDARIAMARRDAPASLVWRKKPFKLGLDQEYSATDLDGARLLFPSTDPTCVPLSTIRAETV